MGDNNDDGETIKIVFLGESGVGKTCIVGVIHGSPFLESQAPTIGACFHVEKYEIDDKKLRLHIWDTAGQEKYRSLAPMYYRDADYILLVFAVNNQDSFYKLDEWQENIKYQCKQAPKLVLIANKIDLEEERKITTEEGEDRAEKLNAMYFELSAKEDPKGVKLMIDRIAKDAANNLKTVSKAVSDTLIVKQQDVSPKSCC